MLTIPSNNIIIMILTIIDSCISHPLKCVNHGISTFQVIGKGTDTEGTQKFSLDRVDISTKLIQAGDSTKQTCVSLNYRIK